MSILWDFLKSPLGRLLASVAAVLALLVGVYLAGHHRGVLAEKSAQAEREKKAVKQVAANAVKSDKISDDAKADLTAKQTETQTRTITLIKKVPEYVTVFDDSRCVVNAGAVSLLDAAARGATLPEAASGHEQDPSAVSLSDLTATGVFNLGVGNEWRNEALTWRQWYADTKAFWDRAYKIAP